MASRSFYGSLILACYMKFIRIFIHYKLFVVPLALCLVTGHFMYLHLLTSTEKLEAVTLLSDMSADTKESKGLISFGAFADIQYANIDNKLNFEQTHWRYYRDSHVKLKHMLQFWSDKEPVQFLLNLGDLIDGHNKGTGESDKALHDTLAIMSQYSINVYHSWGNHDFYNFNRDGLLQHESFNTALALKKGSIKADGSFSTPDGKAYYSFSPHPKLKIIMMDHYEFSPLGRSEYDQTHVKAKAFLRSRNPNQDLNSPTGLFGAECRFVLFNAGVSQTQLKWMESEITEAEENKQYVIVAGHVPVYDKACTQLCLLWNYDVVLDVLHRHGNVIAYLAGHDHDGGYAVDRHGILHLTLHGIIEASPGTSDFASLHLHHTHLFVKGYGRVPSLTLKLPKL